MRLSLFSSCYYRCLLALSLLLTACQSEKEEADRGTTPVVPVAPTPYALEVPPHFPSRYTIPADNPLTEEGVALGRMLFYEPRLSRTNTLSCGSCHQQKRAFTDGLARARGVDGQEHARNTMSLANLLWEPRLTWDGANSSLEQQARTPLENPIEMHQSLAASVGKLQQDAEYPKLFQRAFGTAPITEVQILKALGQFERTLISGNSKYDQRRRGQTALSRDEEIGQRLFYTHPDPAFGIRGGNCGDCHGGDLQTDHEFRNNGLDVTFADRGRSLVTQLPTDNGKFRVPSLRNIALTAPYMHDGRFQTLEEVLDHYNDHFRRDTPNPDPLMLNASNEDQGLTLALTPTEKAQIIKFLHTLTDSSFVQDKRFSDPFKQ